MRSILEGFHDHLIFPRRIEVIARHLANAIPDDADVLDVGCGDGRLAAAVFRIRPDLSIRGMEVQVRADTAIPVSEFDGTTIPLPSDQVDVVLLMDVIHHASHQKQLLAEAARVSRRAVIVKDHLADGIMSRPILRLMDWVGNARHGVSLPYAYWEKDQWLTVIRELELYVVGWSESLNLYPFPANLIFERRLHFLAYLSPSPHPPYDQTAEA